MRVPTWHDNTDYKLQSNALALCFFFFPELIRECEPTFRESFPSPTYAEKVEAKIMSAPWLIADWSLSILSTIKMVRVAHITDKIKELAENIYM